MSRLGLALDLALAEGPSSVMRRLLDRLAAGRRQRQFSGLGPGPLPASLRTPVLHVCAHPPDPWRGGVETQLLARLEAEAQERTVALLHPAGSGHRLELFGPAGRYAADRLAPDRPAVGPRPIDDVARDPALEAAIAWATERVGARLLVVEGLAGQSAASLNRALEAARLDLLLCLHDYSFACPWPALVDAASGEACRLCLDPGDCAVRTGCRTEDVAERRRAAAGLVAASRTIVVPSESLRAGLARIVPGGTVEVVPPALALAPAATRRQNRGGSARKRVAFLGGGQAHKGALLFEQLVAGWSGPALEWHVYGGGDRGTLRRLRRLPGVRIRGYYRTGSLTRRLVAESIDLALLLSPWPESYLMTLDECLAGGVPVVLFDHGAPAERVNRGVGVRVPPEDGLGGVRAVLETWAAGGAPEPFAPRAVPRPEDAARRFREIYERLGVLSRPWSSP